MSKSSLTAFHCKHLLFDYLWPKKMPVLQHKSVTKVVFELCIKFSCFQMCCNANAKITIVHKNRREFYLPYVKCMNGFVKRFHPD